jgi:succinate dehydrogenase / fumarate reductase flavoprotein subunit
MPTADDDGDHLPGLYAAGECACASVHGANRLGGNSLLDILVFGRLAGHNIIEYVKDNSTHRPLDEASVEKAVSRLQRWDAKGEGITVSELRNEFRKAMEDHAGVFRVEEMMAQGVEKVKQLRERLSDVRLSDHSSTFNTNRTEALELENLIDVGLSIAVSALYRKESRGAHSRPDYPKRDDEQWMKHTLYWKQDDKLDYKGVRSQPLTVERFPPKERVY